VCVCVCACVCVCVCVCLNKTRSRLQQRVISLAFESIGTTAGRGTIKILINLSTPWVQKPRGHSLG